MAGMKGSKAESQVTEKMVTYRYAPSPSATRPMAEEPLGRRRIRLNSTSPRPDRRVEKTLPWRLSVVFLHKVHDKGML